MGREWLLSNHAGLATPMVGEQPADFPAAIETARRLLMEARYPLVYGLSDCDTAAQRLAVAIADRLGGVLDNANSATAALLLARQQVGEVTCSLGELKNRADVIVFWGTNPARSQPRHFERYSVDAPGEFLPGGRKDRTVVVVDSRATETTAIADRFLSIPAGRDLEVLWLLRAMLQAASGRPAKRTLRGQGGVIDDDQVRSLGITPEALVDLLALLRKARFGVILFGRGLVQAAGGGQAVRALLELVRDLNAHTCFAAAPMRAGGNVAGAEEATTWQTGFPFGVSFATGSPQFGPVEFSAEQVLRRKQADVALLVGIHDLELLSSSAIDHLGRIPSILVGPKLLAGLKASVVLPTSVYGIHTGGTVYRQDDVPIPLLPFRSSSLPSIGAVLAELLLQIDPAWPGGSKAMEFGKARSG